MMHDVELLPSANHLLLLPGVLYISLYQLYRINKNMFPKKVLEIEMKKVDHQIDNLMKEQLDSEVR